MAFWAAMQEQRRENHTFDVAFRVLPYKAEGWPLRAQSITPLAVGQWGDRSGYNSSDRVEPRLLGL